MIKLSTGDDATLGNYRKMCAAVFGEDSAATKSLDGMIAKQGKDEPVLADERQIIQVLWAMHENGLKCT